MPGAVGGVVGRPRRAGGMLTTASPAAGRTRPRRCAGQRAFGAPITGLRIKPGTRRCRGAAQQRTIAGMDLHVPITLNDELSDEVVTATARLNLASGEIGRIEYQDWDVASRGLPWEQDDYEFTSGTLSNAGKDVEFGVSVNRTTGQYSVSADELLEIKVKAAQLFAGISGSELASGAHGRNGRTH